MGVNWNIFGKEEANDVTDETIERSINKGNSSYIYEGVSIIRPRSYEEDSKRMADLIKASNIVTFSLENISREEGQRLLDYISGAATVCGGKIEQVNDKVFVAIPKGVEVNID